MLLFLAAELARKRRARGLRLNYPEARALIADEILEGARDGRSVAELMEFGAKILTTDDVLPGVDRLVGVLQVEGFFEDGQKLVTVHEPIRPGRERVEGVAARRGGSGRGRDRAQPGSRDRGRTCPNTGDRPIQVGSHYHFFEVNRALRFERELAFGMHLDIPAGTAVRFEPGEEREVELVAFGGERDLHGLNRLTEGGDVGTLRSRGHAPRATRGRDGQANLARSLRRAVRADNGRSRPARRHRAVGRGRARSARARRRVCVRRRQDVA